MCHSCAIHRKGTVTSTQPEFLAIACGRGCKLYILLVCDFYPGSSPINTFLFVANLVSYLYALADRAKTLPGSLSAFPSDEGVENKPAIRPTPFCCAGGVLRSRTMVMPNREPAVRPGSTIQFRYSTNV